MRNSKFATLVVIALLLLSACQMIQADNSVSSDNTTEIKEATAFFDQYLDTYNQRFGHPERSTHFRESLKRLVTDTVMFSPPSGKPQAPPSKDEFAKGFETFVMNLEKKGVVKLQWEKVDINLLSPNKILANNVGIGVDAQGNVHYQTISLYLLVKIDEKWQIALFSPYLKEYALKINQF